jgi:hypothetical protein
LCLWLRLFGGDSGTGQEQLFCLRRHSITVILRSTGDIIWYYGVLVHRCPQTSSRKHLQETRQAEQYLVPRGTANHLDFGRFHCPKRSFINLRPGSSR